MLFREILFIVGWRELNNECDDLMASCYAEATKVTRASQMEKYNEFCREFSDFVTPIPCPPKQVALYISFLTKKLKFSSIKGYVSALSMYMKSI